MTKLLRFENPWVLWYGRLSLTWKWRLSINRNWLALFIYAWERLTCMKLRVKNLVVGVKGDAYGKRESNVKKNGRQKKTWELYTFLHSKSPVFDRDDRTALAMRHFANLPKSQNQSWTFEAHGKFVFSFYLFSSVSRPGLFLLFSSAQSRSIAFRTVRAISPSYSQFKSSKYHFSNLFKSMVT